MLFVIGSPRSGTTMLERMLSSHSEITGGPEPHLLTPLAHLGVWDRVERAAYDPAAASGALKAFAEALPNGEDDYWRACRAYCDVLYGGYLSNHGGSICLDKTPAYALILPFIGKVFPDGKYVVLARHPFAAFSSYANSFFDGDYAAAQKYNPLLKRYVPALASFLRQKEVPFVHVRYEDLVQDTETWMKRICEYIGVAYEPSMVNYGEWNNGPREGLGDPLGVNRHVRPSTASLNKWVRELAHDAEKRRLMESIVDDLDEHDLETIGYPKSEIWTALSNPDGPISEPEKIKTNRYALQRKLIVRGRRFVHDNRSARNMLFKFRGVTRSLLDE